MAEIDLFSDDVVIILGAGASVPFGLPTGLELIELVRDGLFAEAQNLENLKNEIHPKIEDLFSAKIENAPIYCAFFNIFNSDMRTSSGSDKNIHFDFDEAIKFLRAKALWLNSQVSDSIDDLIRYNRSNARLLKICIVYVLLKRTHISEKGLYSTKDFRKRKIAQLTREGDFLFDSSGNKVELRNWIHNFINVVRNNYIKNGNLLDEGNQESKSKKIKIITFNYDGILEEILSLNWSAVDSKLPNWKNIFEILHPHGNISFDSKIAANDLPRYLSRNAKKISVIHDEKVNQTTLEIRKSAKEIVSGARNIYALGFAFARMNCVLLGLDEHKSYSKRTTISYINFDKSASLALRVNTYCRSDRHTDGGYDFGITAVQMVNEHDKYLQITDALMGGFLGEMPS